MSTSTNLVSGLSSGFDWRSMVDQLIAIDRQRVTIIENDKTRYENQLSEWQSFNTKLLSLKTAAEALTDPEDFAACQSSLSADGDSAAEDLVSVSVSDSAAPGFYSMTVEETAAAQRMLSTSFQSSTEELG
ncbi:MAG TPA: flagellar hook protein, partial [Deltaproteobacteria bacterium]|nr:flagellar hook protein [Deltaproteobacteria bacterium]